MDERTDGQTAETYRQTAGIKCGWIEGPSIPANANLILDEFLGNENIEMSYIS